MKKRFSFSYCLIAITLSSFGYALYSGNLTMTDIKHYLSIAGKYLTLTLSYLGYTYFIYWQGILYLWSSLWTAIYWILIIGAFGGGAFGLFLAVVHIGHVINFLIEVIKGVRYSVPITVGAVCGLVCIPFVMLKTFISWTERQGKSRIQSYYLEASYKLFRKVWCSNHIGWKLKTILSIVNLLAVLLAVPTIIIASICVAIVYGAFNAVTHTSGFWFHPDFISQPWKVLVTDYDQWWFDLMIDKFDKHGEPLKENEFKLDISFVALIESIILAPVAMITTSVLGSLITIGMTPAILWNVFKKWILSEKLSGQWHSIRYLMGSCIIMIAAWVSLLAAYAANNNLGFYVVVDSVLNFVTGSWFNVVVTLVVGYISLIVANVVGNGLFGKSNDVNRIDAAWELSLRSTACSLIWVGILIVVGLVPITSILVGLIGGLLFGYAIGLPRGIQLNLDALAHYYRELQHVAGLIEQRPEKPASFNVKPRIIKRFAKQLLIDNNIKATDQQIEQAIEELESDLD